MICKIFDLIREEVSYSANYAARERGCCVRSRVNSHKEIGSKIMHLVVLIHHIDYSITPFYSGLITYCRVPMRDLHSVIQSRRKFCLRTVTWMPYMHVYQ
ncbi:hypothetical protein Mp_6g14000 [Marchantia polymorpha subsp. ruderalis]|uniref:Uncharacterized protein n=2 Tax=Marchantia polymorpha TaxID=3197 RepID=A0AAF6BRU6_MARPO|nr:hypothetical protein MARPO_0047s0056 [Marchantia polymorpha]BBN14730.1 hypothetical protein Mp_6g14000 [Marchantia polymorpha subsp. ruderalis]|eukprot:PTQ39074.1 hypothetical protein MARPO_0047s0056 [Marchantia polymorpha]